jgi:hypothetical protein
MSDDFDDDSEDADESEARLARELRTRGAWIAYRTNVAICQDRKAPASARAQAASNLLRAGGFFTNQDSGSLEKDICEMTAGELAAATRKVLADVEKNQEVEIKKPGGGLFD